MIGKIIGIIVLLSAFSLPIFANIENQISQAKTGIKKQKLDEKKISIKLDAIAKEIAKEDKNLKNINQNILKTKQKIKAQNRKTRIKKGELKKIENLYKELSKREVEVNKKITEILSKQIMIEMIESGGNSDNNVENIVNKELYSSYSNILKDKFSKTKKRYIKLRKNIKIVKGELDKIKNKLTILRTEIKKYDKLKSLKAKSLKKLDNQKGAYLKRLNRSKNEREFLGKTLKKLNITKKDREQTVISSSPKSNTNVRQIGSSYQASALVKYRGKKTIPPLEGYTISQNFGTYTDPIYKMKIFNESVILRANQKNARVKNVLDGKVIYADKTSMLEHVVIIKNRDNIHTIFAHLSKIAPTIKVGKKVPKGYVLGRVARELTFEVTQNDKHINPMRLIK